MPSPDWMPKYIPVPDNETIMKAVYQVRNDAYTAAFANNGKLAQNVNATSMAAALEFAYEAAGLVAQTGKAPNMKYIIIPELHKDGIHYHFHGLLADCSQLTFVDSGIVQNGKIVYNISDFKYGFTTATKVEDTRKVSSYISKYITKDLEIHIKGKRRFLASKNCEKVRVIDYHMTEEEIETLIDSISLDITHMKTQDIPEAHQRIKYIELKKE